MVVFRCTKRLVARLHLPVTHDPGASLGLLGDWYAHTLNVGSDRYVLCLSERTLLPVIVRARKADFPATFPQALARILEALGIAQDAIERELAACQEPLFAPTRSRVLLGAMNDFAFNASANFAHPGLRPSITPHDV